MRYLSLFSGIEAATVAWESLGFEPVAFAEIDKHASALLAEKYPNVPNLGDVTRITQDDLKKLDRIDLVVFGSPCQDLSVAGKKLGLEGARSGLFRTAINIIDWARGINGCRFALWENVPGALSTHCGADFAEVVGALSGCPDITVPSHGWGKEGAALGAKGLVEWCVLDAQWFGLAQRRKRLFVIADFGNWHDRPPILLERESVRGSTAPSRSSQQNRTECPTSVVVSPSLSSEPITFDTSGSFYSFSTGNLCGTLTASKIKAVAYELNPPAAVIRNLTPLECERLQGFPDGYTCSLSMTQRYKALGNSIAVPVLRWIGINLLQAVSQHEC